MKCFDNAGGGSGRRIPLRAWVIVVAGLPVHLVLALATDLSPDEAYYLCAARLGAPLVDHPPLLVWLLRWSDRLAFAPLELRVRIWAMLFSLLTGLALVVLARRRGAGPEGCVLAAWLGSFSLLPTAGGFVTTPDGPLLLAVVLGLLLAGDRALLAVPVLFLGALAKATALPIAAALAAGDRGASTKVRVALALGPLAAAPFFWPSLRFQVAHAYGSQGSWSMPAALGAAVAALAAQALLWSPLVLFLGVRRSRLLPGPDRAVAVSITALVVLSAIVRGVPPEANWWAPAAVVVLTAFTLAPPMAARARQALLASVLLPTAIAVTHTVSPYLPLPEHLDPTARLHGWSRGRMPLTAPGIGPYGPAAERCVHLGSCDEISLYFKRMRLHE